MKRKAVNFSFFILYSFAFQILLWEVWIFFSPKEKPTVFYSKNGEHFDPSLSRITSISAFSAYCDSLYANTTINASDSEKYASIVCNTLRERFYHGYSYYSLGQNSLACFLAPVIKKELSAIVLPDDILKHPSAACSQQSIVGMEVFKRKGFNVRKVGFFLDGHGHFCYEVFFNSKWHFFDPDREPALSLMIENHFPSVEELVNNNSLLQKLYYRESKDYTQKLFHNYTYGPVNKFPATNARIYQYITKYLSYTLGLWVALLYFFVQKKLVTKKKEQCAELQGSLISEIRA